jgi:hypothetical protein
MVVSAETKKILERRNGIGVRELWMLRWREEDAEYQIRHLKPRSSVLSNLGNVISR